MRADREKPVVPGPGDFRGGTAMHTVGTRMPPELSGVGEPDPPLALEAREEHVATVDRPSHFGIIGAY